MAKIQDKLYNRIIEGELLELTEAEKVKLGIGLITQNGNTTVIGDNLDVDGSITGDEIVEKSANYSIIKPTTSVLQQSTTITYAGVVKNGNKITFAVAGNITPTENLDVGVSGTMLVFNGINPLVGAKIIPINDNNHVSINQLQIASSLFDTITLNTIFVKNSNTSFYVHIHNNDKIMESGKKYNFRYEITFLLSDNLAV